MKKIADRLDCKLLPKGWLLTLLVLVLYGGVGVQGAPHISSAHATVSPADVTSAAAVSSTATDLSARSFFYDDFEIKIEVEEDDDDSRVSHGSLFHPQSHPLVLKERVSTSSFLAHQPVKLFILFHSWKSFLLV